MASEIKEYNKNLFENIKHTDQFRQEYWLARELQNVLEYKEWRKFERVIEKAKITCINSNNDINDHFVGADKMIKLAKGATRKVNDYILSRYACYLIAQNGGTMPENLPTPDKSLKELEKEITYKIT